MRKRAWAAGASLTAVGGWLAKRYRSLDKDAQRFRSLDKDAKRFLRRTVNLGKGLAYRAMRRHPSTSVDDSVLADRIRSAIGPLEKQLHNSRINVTVENGIAILHGDVEDPGAADQIEEAVRAVAGVVDVRSHLSP